MEQSQKEFLTIGETQAMLGTSRNFVYTLIANGLPRYKVGRRAYIKKEEVESLFRRETKNLSQRQN